MNSSAERIPTNLITGFLGAGKTSAIQSLLPFRPPQERWAVLVNEYGMVSLDHILIGEAEGGSTGADGGVHIDELAGGCFCCTLSMALPLLLARIVRKVKPHRILLEPTGSGHPASVIDLLRTGRLSELLELRATICLVDPRDYENPRITSSQVFQDQIQMADVVALNFSDKCPRDQIDRCRKFVDDQYPPKILVGETSFGRLQPEWLDVTSTVGRLPLWPHAHLHPVPPDQNTHAPHHAADAPHHAADAALNPAGHEGNRQAAATAVPSEPLVALQRPPEPGKPVRFENEGLGQFACGWIFSAEDVFDRDRLLDLLGALPSVVRLKGVFHCRDDWWSVQRRGLDTRFQRSAYRRDSRLEVIAEQYSGGWSDVEQQLLDCLRASRQTPL